MVSLVATPACYIDIYPFEGGAYTLSGDNANLLSLTTSKNIRTGQGTFNMTLAPGGPYGPNARPGWLEILTPMSLVVIGHARAGRAAVTMIGVVKTINTTEAWVPGQGVRRALVVGGFDFSYFFGLPNYYTQSLLNFTSPASPAAAGALGVALSLDSIDMGLLDGTPDTIGEAWYEKIMAGPQSIMNALTFPYLGSRQTFYTLMATWFQAYSQASSHIPLGDNFMVADGTWDSKFREIFPFPWYEFFVTTVPVGTFQQSQNPGYGLSVQAMPYAYPSVPQLVARVNPLPRLTNTGSTANPVFGIDTSLWTALPITSLDSQPLQNGLAFDDSEVRNFYVLNPLWLSNQFGITNDNQTPFTFMFATWLDVASIHRYGYRPEISEIHWFADLHGMAAQQNAAAGTGIPEYDTLVGDLALKKIGYHQPTPNMLRGGIVTNLRPDILPGTRLMLQPFKDTQQWQFYIEGVTHNWQFGANATTQLDLTRGLPDSVYNDNNMMIALHTGNAMRLSGQYTIGLPPGLGPSLAPLNNQTNAALTGDIAAVFAAPQTR